MIVILWLLALAGLTSATRIYKQSINPERCNKSATGLFVVESFYPPKKYISIIGKQTYLSTYVETSMNYTVYTPEMKYPPRINTTNHMSAWGVSVRTTNRPFRDLANCTHRRVSKKYVWVLCDKDNLQALAERNDVYWITSIPYIHLNSIESRRLLTGNIDLSSSTWNGTGTKILVSDSGLDTKHCAFYDNHPVQLNSFAENNHKKILGYKSSVNDFVSLDRSHGTSTCHAAAGFPCLSQSGVAPYAKLAFLDMSTGDEYLTLPSNFDVLIDDAISHGIYVHSASWGSSTNGFYTDLDGIMDEIGYDNPNFVTVVAAGNDGPLGKVGSPASAKSVVSVGAAYSRPEDYFPTSPTYTYELQASFSSIGPLRDGRRAPLVLAPGVLVQAARGLPPPSLDNHANYHRVSGTSFATPAIAGLVLLYQQRYKSLHGGALPPSALVRAMLIAHARPATAIQGGVGSLSSYGTPIVDFDSMVDILGVVTSSIQRYCILVNSTEPVPTEWSLGFSWTEPRAHPGSSVTIINNLDLYVIAENGVFLGQAVDAVNTFGKLKFQSQNIRILVEAQVLSTINQQFAIHIKGKGVASECAGTCFPTEFETCTGGKRICQPDGLFSTCKAQTCPDGFCGADCTTPCGLPCSIPNGVGALNNNTCLPTSCTHPYFLTNTSCACLNGTAIECEQGWGACNQDSFVCVATEPPPNIIAMGSIASNDLIAYLIVFVVMLWVY